MEGKKRWCAGWLREAHVGAVNVSKKKTWRGGGISLAVTHSTLPAVAYVESP